MSTKINVFVPQWQGSGVSSELYDGALSLKNYIKKKSVDFNDIHIPLNSSADMENNIIAYKVIKKQLSTLSDLLNNKSPSRIFTLGGGCGIEIPVLSYLSGLYPDMDVIWFDAHGDLNTPESSPSKYFHGMPLRFLLDEIPGNDISHQYKKLKCEDIVLAGVRDLDAPEKDYIIRKNLKILKPAGQEENRAERLTCLLNPANRHVYLHIDLDVLDPGEYKNVKCPSKDGFRIQEVLSFIKAVNSEKKIVGMSLLENTESDPRKLELLNGIIESAINF